MSANGRDREAKIRWVQHPDGSMEPDVEHLTGTEARGALRTVMLRCAQAETLGRMAVQVIVSLLYRDALRGIVGVDGRPQVPLSTVLEAPIAAAGREGWDASWEVREDGSIALSAAPKAVEAPKVALQ